MATFRSWLSSVWLSSKRNSTASSTKFSLSQLQRTQPDADRAPLTFDAQSISAAVYERHGIALDEKDPAFLLVTINELVLQSTIQDLDARVVHMIQQAQQEMDAMRTHAASNLGKEVRSAVIAIRREMQNDIDAAKLEAHSLVEEIQRAYSALHIRRWIAAGIVAAAALLTCGFLIGYFFSKGKIL